MNHAEINAIAPNPLPVLDHWLVLSQVLFSSAERVLALNAAAAQDQVADGATFARALSGVATLGAWQEVQGDLAGPMLHRALAYQRSLWDIALDAQGGMGRVWIAACRPPALDMAMPPSWMDLVAGLSNVTPQGRRAGALFARPVA